MAKGKMKSHSGAKKRFKITAGGKVAYKKMGRSHLLFKKSEKRIRNLRKKGYLEGEDAKRIKKLLPYE